SALFADITKGAPKLRKAVTNDRSAPIVGNENKSGGPLIGGAPPVPGMPKAPGGLAPPVPSANRLRSSSDAGPARDDSGSSGATSGAPQLGGLFAGGMPKLRSRGGVDTGANRDSSYLSDSEATRPRATTASAPRPPVGAAPKPPGAHPPPVPPSAPESPAPNPLVANLRRPPPKPASRPSSTLEIPPRAPPPLPGSGKTPPPPPPLASRKPSGT
ncbi:hypothetical protein F66182_18221, partial [Fusarium sp. NRRL 66182]